MSTPVYFHCQLHVPRGRRGRGPGPYDYAAQSAGVAEAAIAPATLAGVGLMRCGCSQAAWAIEIAAAIIFSLWIAAPFERRLSKAELSYPKVTEGGFVLSCGTCASFGHCCSWERCSPVLLAYLRLSRFRRHRAAVLVRCVRCTQRGSPKEKGCLVSTPIYRNKAASAVQTSRPEDFSHNSLPQFCRLIRLSFSPRSLIKALCSAY